MGGINMKMIQQMQNRMAKIQQELEETVVDGTAGGGVVTAQVTGSREFKGLKIDPSVGRSGGRGDARGPHHCRHSGRHDQGDRAELGATRGAHRRHEDSRVDVGLLRRRSSRCQSSGTALSSSGSQTSSG